MTTKQATALLAQHSLPLAFTVRFDAAFVRELDNQRARLGDIFGLPVSRQNYLMYACRHLWDADTAKPAATTSRRKAAKAAR